MYLACTTQYHEVARSGDGMKEMEIKIRLSWRIF
jgi:hypothetical protein